jgi:hypothetical protein
MVRENPQAILKGGQIPYWEEPIEPAQEKKLKIKIPKFLGKFLK